MSKNTSPQTRSSSGPRSSTRGRGRTKAASPSAARVASTVGKEVKARRDPGPVTWGSRIRRMLFVVAVPNLVAFFSLVVIALATVLLTSSPSAWLPTAIAESWVVANLAPVEAGGIVISAMPTLPALILGWMVAANIHRAVKDKVSINDLLVLLAWVIVIPLVLIFIAWFMLWDASQVYDLSPPALGPTIARTLVLHLTALVIGMGPRLWRALARRYKVPRAVVDGAVLAIRSLVAVLIVAAVVLLALFIFNWDNQTLIMDSYPQLAGLGIFSLIGLSILYLPNALVAAGSVLLGSEFHIGDASISLFSVHLVPLPPLPLLGVIPASVSPLAIGLLVLTAVAIGYVGVKAKPNFIQAASAGIAAGLLALIFGYFISGQLGYYESVGTMLLMSAGLAILWVGGINLAVSAGYFINTRRNAPAIPAEPEASAQGVGVEATGQAEAEANTETTAADNEAADSDSAAEIEEAAEEVAVQETESSNAENAAPGEEQENTPDTEHTVVQESEASEELSDDLKDNLEDGAFPDSALGDDDIDGRFEDESAADNTDQERTWDSTEPEGEGFQAEQRHNAGALNGDRNSDLNADFNEYFDEENIIDGEVVEDESEPDTSVNDEAAGGSVDDSAEDDEKNR
ncbi:DUF6350 family protein [Corynebacterium sp. L4756]|uniref:cell division protein PerM n=1 Tax=unclassified Corynebacterium TaxID=2624378 RepID=UPI00374C92B7